MTPSLFQAFRRVAQNGEWRGRGCGKQKKGEGREDEGYFTLSPYPHHLAVVSCAHFTWSVGSRSVHTSKKGGRAKKKRASEKGREEGGFGPTFHLTLSLLSYSLEKANLFYTYV